MTTAGDLIKQSMRLIGALASGEEPTADEASDALRAFNQMLDSWTLESLSVFTTQIDSIAWPANTPSLTYGPTGTVVGVRPIRILPGSYFDIDGLSYPLQLISDQQYSLIAMKSLDTAWPLYLYVRPTMPNVTLYLFPVPSVAVTLKFFTAQPLTQPADWSTVLTYPPGYEQALKYNFAYLLAGEYGRAGSSAMTPILTESIASKRRLKRINNRGGPLQSAYWVSANGAYSYNIYTGEY